MLVFGAWTESAWHAHLIMVWGRVLDAVLLVSVGPGLLRA